MFIKTPKRFSAVNVFVCRETSLELSINSHPFPVHSLLEGDLLGHDIVCLGFSLDNLSVSMALNFSVL